TIFSRDWSSDVCSSDLWVNKYIIVNLFHLLEKVFSSYGVIIILIVFIIKLFLLPLTYKSYVGMAKMRVIKPEIDELKEKYGDDRSEERREGKERRCRRA